MKIIGYGDRLSAAPGETIAFKISSTEPAYRADLVRLVRGGAPGTDPLLEEEVACPLAGDHPGRVQTSVIGSYVEGAWDAPLSFDGWSAAAWIWPTAPDRAEPQTVLATVGDLAPALAVTPRGLALLDDGGTVLACTGVPVAEREWCFVAVTVDPARHEVVMVQRPVERLPVVHRVVVPAATAGAPGGGGTAVGTANGVLAGASAPAPAGAFNGKIARPTLLRKAVPLAELDALADDRETALARLGDAVAAAWDFAAEPHGSRVPDLGRRDATGRCVNLPTRAVTGPRWSGAEPNFRHAPAEYDAIHFHDDDFADCGWDTDLTFTVPPDLRSGVYALRVGAGGDTDRIPFAVRAAPSAPPAPVLVLLPTWTYLAYANWRTYVEEFDDRTRMYGEERHPDPVDHFLVAHPELGLSLYDHHSDGSGVAYSSRLRPILNMRPTYYTPTTKALRHFAADLYLIWWLERRGVPYAVATDDDLHEQGTDLLRRHTVVLTGSHPEYVSGRMLDALEEFTGNGGRLMYLGGNGFYWVTAPLPEAPHIVEIRRGAGARRVWDSEPGEEYLAATGEPGGLWRYRGRAPQRLTGVGMTAQGFDTASPYRRSDDSHDPAVSWIFDGVAGEVFGDAGIGLGGAAGDEIDRADPVLGTPRDAWVLAGSFGHSEKIVLSFDEQTRAVSGATVSGPTATNKRADLVAFGRPGGGAVFSVGSICWLSALAYADLDNDVARITGNVLDRFLDAAVPVPAHP